MQRVRFIVAFAGMMAMTGSAYAQPATMSVQISDLNLQTDRGAFTALGRIKAASRAFCGDAYKPDVSRYLLVEQCVRTMTAKAVEQAKAPRLATFNNAQRVPVAVAVK